jgi:hypothetical protein
LQLGLAVAIDQWAPELRDPEFGQKLARLRALCADFPDRPLLLVLGSSRSDYGVCPDALQHPLASERQNAAVFNFAVMGGGPVTELVLFHELLAERVRPRCVLIEVNPLLLHQGPDFTEESWLHADRLEFGQLRRLRRYVSRPWSMYGRWLASRIVPWHSHRFLILDRIAPAWLAASNRQDRRTPSDDHGWLRHQPETVTAGERNWRIEQQLKAYAPSLDRFCISLAPDRALRELLDSCRQERIDAALLTMPESSELRAAFGPQAALSLASYLDDLRREYGVSLLDARDWSPDADFVDGEHLLPGGAIRFSQRLERGAAQFLARAASRPARENQAAEFTARRQGSEAHR